MTKLPRRDKL